MRIILECAENFLILCYRPKCSWVVIYILHKNYQHKTIEDVFFVI